MSMGSYQNIQKNKLLNKERINVVDFVKNPIVIKNNNKYDIFSEKVLQKLILEDLENFLEELGNGFTFIKSEYKIKLDDRYNYIDSNIKTTEENKTVGVIICKQDNEYVIKYCSDDRIIARKYELV